MAAVAPTEAQLAHQQLLEELDIHSVEKTFRNPAWKPSQRRNRNIKTILLDASKREAASTAIATPAEGATGTGGGGEDSAADPASASGASTPLAGAPPDDAQVPNLALASRSLSKLVLEKSLGGKSGLGGGGSGGGPAVTYTNIESAPSLAHSKHYCDVTGLPAPYVDPKTRMRYHNKEIFSLIRDLPPGAAEQYLEARGAHTVLK